jgi:hypothetical protein
MRRVAATPALQGDRPAWMLCRVQVAEGVGRRTAGGQEEAGEGMGCLKAATLRTRENNRNTQK